MKPSSILISLESASGIVKYSFYQYLQYALQNQLPNEILETLQAHGAVNYNPVPYLQMLINEIGDENYNNMVPSEYSLPSTKLLLQHGLDRSLAKQTANNAFKAVTDAISVSIPELAFGNYRGCQMDVCGEMDLMIALPIPEHNDNAHYQ
jgi:hypothetical protein